MKIELYPEFEQLFENDVLKGIFYPLCKVFDSESVDSPLFFVSSNGIWTDDNVKHENNQSNYVRFQLKNGKYFFNGDLNVYKGYEHAKNVIKTLELDFKKNGESYLSKKIKSTQYIQKITDNYDINFGALDSEYYLKTFYEFSINKLNYSKTGRFGTFNEVINGWGKADKSPIVYQLTNDNNCGFADIEVNKEFLFPKTIKIEKYKKIGFVIGHEFFTDGNDIYLIHDVENNKVVCINHYS